jgi:hypothetical protein
MGKKITNDEFIKRSNIIHRNFYEYMDEYKNARGKIKIMCPNMVSLNKCHTHTYKE